MSIVRVQFVEGGQCYSYFVPKGDDPRVGDIVITDSSDGNIKASAVVKEVVTADIKATKEYLILISAERLKERLTERAVSSAKRKAKQVAMVKLREKLDERALISMAETAAAQDPEIRRLVSILKEE